MRVCVCVWMLVHVRKDSEWSLCYKYINKVHLAQFIWQDGGWLALYQREEAHKCKDMMLRWRESHKSASMQLKQHICISTKLHGWVDTFAQALHKCNFIIAGFSTQTLIELQVSGWPSRLSVLTFNLSTSSDRWDSETEEFLSLCYEIMTFWPFGRQHTSSHADCWSCTASGVDSFHNGSI